MSKKHLSKRKKIPGKERSYHGTQAWEEGLNPSQAKKVQEKLIVEMILGGVTSLLHFLNGLVELSIVSQEPVLFNCSIEENIAYGLNGNASNTDIENAAKMANAHEFVSKFPEQYKTFVGERGIRLSGGQKQRIAIARALMMNPRILLLDEATSALDAESEYLVQDAMDSLMEGRTVLVIAHRLSTVKSADVVAVVFEGQIAESGTHDGLLSKNGIYTALVKRQLQAPKVEI
ncbi:hypothetical protein HPP92_018795 [Vanilla planifolia]|uniref:ABC transporter domain-containing protein n=1 Tax=Vanilla planifolia TaxID=51239 RepID=A0A835Q1R4_VANPL|nr:hypothetical protein HPP92_018795 [Vanilla planifolia]